MKFQFSLTNLFLQFLKLIYQSIIPMAAEEASEEEAAISNAVFEFEPDKNELLEYLVPRNFLTQIYRSILEKLSIRACCKNDFNG